MAEAPSPIAAAGTPPGATARRRWLAVGGLGGRALAWVILAVVAIAAADRSRLVVDLSADRRFSPDPALERLIAAQAEPVEVVGVWGVDEQAALEPVEALLRHLDEDSPKLRFRRIDPVLRRPELEAFAAAHGGARARGIYVARGERAQLIPLGMRTRLTLQSELGGALLALADARVPRAALLQGHGELAPGGPDVDSADELGQALRLAGFAPSVFEAGGSSALPADALLVVAGPTRPLGDAALATMTQHLQDGGAALVLADDRAPDDLARWLRARGVLAAGGFPTSLAQGDPSGLLDPAAPGMPGTVLHSRSFHFGGQERGFPHHNLELGVYGDNASLLNGQHPITASLATERVRVLSPRTSEVMAFTPAWLAERDATLGARFAAYPTAPTSAEWLLTTAPGDAWRQRFTPVLAMPEGLDQADGHALAWALEYPPHAESARHGVAARMIVWGSRQAASDAVLAQEAFANADLLRGMTAWLARRAAPPDIAHAPRRAFQTDLDDRGLYVLLAGLVVVLPCLMLGAAMLTWWDRRR